MKLLVSVRSPDEALLVARGGADFIDLKEPSRGALGGLPVETIRATVAALRAAGSRLPVSATIGDWSMADADGIVAQARAVGDCGVDYVKVGILAEPGADAVLARLAALPFAVVPVFIADQPLDDRLIGQACQACGGGFPAVMADTADKRGGSLLARRSRPELERFVATVQAAGKLVGLAGALRDPDLPAIVRLAPDFAGFRSAVCDGDRAGALSAARLQALVQRVRVLQEDAQPLSVK